MSAGSRADHQQFCRTEQWALVRDARGRPVRHHVTFELALWNGRVLRTRISRPVNPTTYGPGLWRTILREQLEVTEGEFRACVNDQRLPDRGRPVLEPDPGALPAGLVYQLIHVAGLAEDEVSQMTLAQAVEAMAVHWSAPRRPE